MYCFAVTESCGMVFVQGQKNTATPLIQSTGSGTWFVFTLCVCVWLFYKIVFVTNDDALKVSKNGWSFKSNKCQCDVLDLVVMR